MDRSHDQNYFMKQLLRTLIFFSFFVSGSLFLFSQKPSIDTGTFINWPSLGGWPVLSNDGGYISYTVRNEPKGTRKTLIQSTTSKWKKELAGIFPVSFTNDSHITIYKSKDSLLLLTSGEDKLDYIAGVSEYALPEAGNWLVYRLTASPADIILRDMTNGKEQRLPSVSRYQFIDNGKTVLIVKEESKDSMTVSYLRWLDLQTGKEKNIWSSSGNADQLGTIAVSAENNQLAFMAGSKKDNVQTYALWYYKPGIDSAIQLLKDQSAGIEEGLLLSGLTPEFSKHGNEIFFGLIKRPEEPGKPKPGAAKVDVWSYMDRDLQSSQQANPEQDEIYLSVIHIDDKKVIRLVHHEETIDGQSDDFVMVRCEHGYFGIYEAYWNRTVQTSYWLVSVRNGSRKLLRDHIVQTAEGYGMSPGGKWLLYYDRVQKNFFSYELSTGISRNITKGIAENWVDKSDERPHFQLTWVPWRRTWLKGDEAVLIYGCYDIWQVDPSGMKPPVNLTNGYGRLHHIKFTLTDEGTGTQELSLKDGPTVVLSAVNEVNKDRGFYTKKLGSPAGPEPGLIGPYVLGDWEGYNRYNFPPVKAKGANVYVTTRMSATEAPNYFVTRDFKSFTALTDIQPQKAYNWMTTELIHWKTFDGTMTDGILFKPENFDPQKKYPLIFDYYERRSDELNMYVTPLYAANRINVAWYVSNGYLVFSPDIHYKTGKPGESAFNAIVSGAEYLAKKPWVDPKRMGIQGHSFGGYETNYLVTHTNLFAAACSASGMSDLISFYGSVPRSGNTKYFSEKDEGRMDATPWQSPEAYIKNSPIFQADKVMTPLLMMNNKNDAQVPFAQGVEFFTALRRLGKRVWMLQYDQGGHSAGEDEDVRDFSTRMMQFFDHYLKGVPAPVWMTRGIPAKYKGMDDGLRFDTELKTPGPGLNADTP